MRLPLLLATVFLLPIGVWFPTVLDDARFDSAFLCLTTFGLSLWLRPRALPGTLLFASALGIGILTALLGLESDSWFLSAGGFVDRAPWIGAWVLACVAAVQPHALERTWPWVLRGGFVAAFIAGLQAFGIDPLGWRADPQAPPVAPFSGTNHGAEVLAPLLLLGILKETHRGWRVCILPVAYLLGHWDVTAAILSLSVSGGLLAWKHPKHRLLTAGMLLALYAGFSLAPSSASQPPPIAQNESTSDLTAEKSRITSSNIPRSFQIRWLTGVAGLQQFLAQPWGIGLGRYEVTAPYWEPLELQSLQSHEFTNPTTARAKDPHCEPLLALIELGWLGSLLLLGALWRVLRHPQRAAWTMYPLLVLGIHALVRSPFSDNGSSLALAGLLLGAQTFKTQAEQETAPRRSWLPFLLVAPTLITASHQIAGEWHVSRALSQGERNGKEFTAAQTPLEKAVHWRPWDAVAWDLLAAQRSQEGRPVDEILHALQQAVRFDPSDLFALTHLFQIGAATGDLKLQLGAMERAELVAPGHPAVLENRTLWLEANADELKRQAREALLQGPSQVDVRPTFLLAHTLQALCHLRRSEQEQAFASLKQAAIYADQQRPLIQRMARQETLSETEIHALFRRIAPESMSRFLPAERDSAQ